MHDYDKTSKWLIQHHGDSLLRIAGVHNLIAWRPLQSEVVQPRQLPDGLVEAQLAGEPEPRLFVLELATYPIAASSNRSCGTWPWSTWTAGRCPRC